jgi:hypothetical protein
MASLALQLTMAERRARVGAPRMRRLEDGRHMSVVVADEAGIGTFAAVLRHGRRG